MYFLDMDKRAEGLFDSKREVNSLLYFRMQYFFLLKKDWWLYQILRLKHTFESVDDILWWHHSNKTALSVLFS